MKWETFSALFGEVIINRTASSGDVARCWCALCDKPNQKIVGLNPWIGWDGQQVCVYATCQTCSEALMTATLRLDAKFGNQVERTLLARYPTLYKCFPDGY
jgi:hypothetical protein